MHAITIRNIYVVFICCVLEDTHMHAITVKKKGLQFEEWKRVYGRVWREREGNWECCDYIIILKRRKQKKERPVWVKSHIHWQL